MIPADTLRDLGLKYEQRFAALEPDREAVWEVLVTDCFQQYVPAKANLLDLGAGWGEFIRHVKAGRRFAMDLNPDMQAHVGPGVQILQPDRSQRWPLASDRGTQALVTAPNYAAADLDRLCATTAIGLR